MIEHQLKADLPTPDPSRTEETPSIHRLPSNALIFETCMRRIVIHPWGETLNRAEDAPPLLTGAAAYAFMLEVLAGLQSPVFGKTEIFSQFKTFWENTQKSSSQYYFFAPWARRLIEDTKKIRSEFFRDGTTQTWGGVVRKSLRAYQEVWIIGNGQLALSVAAALKSQDVIFWARREKPNVPGRHHPWGILPPPRHNGVSRAVVICAPLENSEVLGLSELKPNHFQWVADLRDAQSFNADFIDFRVADIDALSELNQKRVLEIQHQALHRVKTLTADTWDLLWHRPLGWEELCG